jgi:hypothetical protein
VWVYVLTEETAPCQEKALCCLLGKKCVCVLVAYPRVFPGACAPTEEVSVLVEVAMPPERKIRVPSGQCAERKAIFTSRWLLGVTNVGLGRKKRDLGSPPKGIPRTSGISRGKATDQKPLAWEGMFEYCRGIILGISRGKQSTCKKKAPLLRWGLGNQ